MVKIRLQREGKKKAPFYHIVVADSKCPRDGKIIEKIGTYDPMTEPSTVVLDQYFSKLFIKICYPKTTEVNEKIKDF